MDDCDVVGGGDDACEDEVKSECEDVAGGGDDESDDQVKSEAMCEENSEEERADQEAGGDSENDRHDEDEVEHDVVDDDEGLFIPAGVEHGDIGGSFDPSPEPIHLPSSAPSAVPSSVSVPKPSFAIRPTATPASVRPTSACLFTPTPVPSAAVEGSGSGVGGAVPSQVKGGAVAGHKGGKGIKGKGYGHPGMVVATQRPPWAKGKGRGKLWSYDEWGGQYVPGGYFYQGEFFE